MTSGLEVTLHHRFPRLEIHSTFSVGRETLALVGPSGAGKSSVLKFIVGLAHPERGRVRLEARTLLDTASGLDLPPERRRMGLVLQDGGLFPHLTVERNVAYGMRRRDPKLLRALLARFGIEGLAHARPGSLSGGERQRVGLARAVASDPGALLLDEPLSALDPVTKALVAEELAGHLRDVGRPAILVTHEYGDALGLADRIAVMEEGQIVQIGRPGELVGSPASEFVAAFAGLNYFPGIASRRGPLTEVRAPGGGIICASTDSVEGPVGVVVSPWDVSLSRSRPDGSALNAVEGPVVKISPVGNRVRVTLAGPPRVVAEVTAESAARLRIVLGMRLVGTWKATGTRLVRSAGSPAVGKFAAAVSS